MFLCSEVLDTIEVPEATHVLSSTVPKSKACVVRHMLPSDTREELTTYILVTNQRDMNFRRRVMMSNDNAHPDKITDYDDLCGVVNCEGFCLNDILTPRRWGAHSLVVCQEFATTHTVQACSNCTWVSKQENNNNIEIHLLPIEE